MKSLHAAVATVVTGLSFAVPALAQDSAATSESSGSESSTSSSDESGHDHGLGLEWLWIDADIGYSYANLSSFNASNFALQNTASSGLVAGGGAGIRLLFLTLGLRARDLPMSNFNLVELDGEAAFHARMGHGDLYFGARGGYAFSGNLSGSTLESAASSGGTPPNVNVHGGNAGMIFGFDYYFNHYLSLGIDGNPEALFLQRPPAALPVIPTNGTPEEIAAAQAVRAQLAAEPLYKESGSSIGFAFLGTAHVGVHF